ncbi:MAG: signal peptidase I [Anaerolineae bacterium]|nr:signal peptidase I [Anaerolineae bacterium]
MEPEQEQPKTGSTLRELLETLILTLVTYLLVRTFLFETYRVVGQSMEPTLQQDQRLIVSKLSYRLHEPQRGDIVVFHDPHDSSRNLIKRIVGLPGEILEIRNGLVFVNGQQLDESYLNDYSGRSEPQTAIPEGYYFVMGDNRNNSSDSRSWGALDAAQIVGKAAFTYWPVSLWGPAPHETYGAQP